MTPHSSTPHSVPSIVPWFEPFIATALILSTYLFFYKTSLTNVELVLLIVLVTSVYFCSSELTRRTWSFAHRPQQRISTVIDHTITRFLGMVLGIVAILFAVWLFPEYNQPHYRRLLFEAVPLFLASFIPLSLVIIFLTEYLLGEKRDGTYQFGLIARFRWSEVEGKAFRAGVLEWLVRGIFLLINFFAVSTLLARVRSRELPDLSDGFVQFVMNIDSMIFMLILLVILPGYLFASRLIGTEVKKVDSTWFAWAITLSSYSPLNAAVYSAWITYRPLSDVYENTHVWGVIGAVHPTVLYCLGALILIAALFHLWGEAILGARSSNLSMRGIITNGPFAFTKHPVYVSKCIQWACIYLPILNGIGFLDATRSGILFILVCVVFGARALAEERLLAEDENYVAYARMMDEKSIFAFVGRAFPWMRFDWRYNYWQRQGHFTR